MSDDATELRAFLRHRGGDWGLSDARLGDIAAAARQHVGRLRLSWKVVAEEILQDAEDGFGLDERGRGL